MNNLIPNISVIIPVYQGGHAFRTCLLSVTGSAPSDAEIIVVADGETDDSVRLAKDLGIQVVQIPTTGGPARARNLGAQAAKGTILFFVDADVTIPQDAISQIVRIFDQEPELAAVFGSYDDEPFETNFLSQYKNLFHHYVHQTGNEDASTFWAGCGAIRREIFLKMGGFNPGYRHPCIEDIELGYRLKKAGYNIRLIKELQVKHLKHWRVLSLLKTDIFYRALPWTNLILKEGHVINDLNLKTSSRICVIVAYLFLLTLLGSGYMPWLLLVTLLFMIVLLTVNWDLYRFFFRKRGLCFAIMTIPWHWLYFLYSGLAFVIGLLTDRLRRWT